MPNKKQDKWQKVERAKGRPLLQWAGKQPIESVQYYPAQEKEVYGDKSAKEFNKLFWGDNLQVLSHLLKEHRGAVDLIYIDPPFDSAAEYVKKVQVRGQKIEGVQHSLIEEAQYTDIWEKDEYLQFMYERLLLMKELLSEDGIFVLHCDWHKSAYLRLLLDEIFGDSNFINEIIWRYFMGGKSKDFFARKHDNLFIYGRSEKSKLKVGTRERILPYKPNLIDENSKIKEFRGVETKTQEERFFYTSEVKEDDVWEISGVFNMGAEDTRYPTQKPRALLERIIEAATEKGDLVADFFVGAGTTCITAQELERRWIGCDINIGAIQTSTKEINKVVEAQRKDKDGKLIKSDFKGFLGFKVLNVNEYDVFKNELEAKEIVMEMYGVEPVKRSYFEGTLDNDYVKIISLNRVLNKMDIRSVLKNIEDSIDSFTPKKQSKAGEAVYEEGVLIICSGMELDARDFLKKENKTGVEVKVYDILTDTKDLIFKQYPESKIKVAAKDKKLSVEIQEFVSPILMRKLELENEKVLKKEREARVKDFKQIIDSVAIDVDYDGKLFNAEIMDLPDKKDVVEGKYAWEYEKKGKYTVAVKIIDVLGEEYFETFEVNA